MQEQHPQIPSREAETLRKSLFLVSAAILAAAILISLSILALGFGKGVNPRGLTGSAVNNAAVPDPDEEAVVEETAGEKYAPFAECVAENPFKEEIAKDMSDGEKAGVAGTPAFIIGTLSKDGKVVGERLAGAQPFASFKKILDERLSGAAVSGEKAEVSIDDDPLLGDRNKARVAIVEFSDYECPFCKRFHEQTYAQIVKEYVDTGKAVFVFRDYPLNFHEPMATKEAIAAECVQKLGGDKAYFEYGQLLFKTTKANGKGMSDAKMEDLAAQVLKK